MADFPSGAYHLPVLSSLGTEAVGSSIQNANASVTGAGGASTWPTANKALFLPLMLKAPYVARTAWWANGAAAAGNVDLGIYTLDGALITSLGSTAQSGTSVIQSAAFGTAVLLTPGSYYLALAASSASATFNRFTGAAIGLIALQLVGAAKMASAFPLPSPATLIAATDAYLPLCGIASQTVI